MRTTHRIGLATLILWLGTASAWAGPTYRLVLQTRADSGPLSEVFVASYDSYGALVDSPALVGGNFSGIDIVPTYTVAGLAYDGQYRLALASRADSGAGNDLFIATYGSFADLVNSPSGVGGDFSGIDVGTGYRVAGLAYDGRYRLALTTRSDGGAGDELFIATYDSYADLVNSPRAVGGDFSGIDIGPGYTVAGLTYDGQYRLALTTRDDSGSGTELFIATYATFTDLVNSPSAVGGDFSGINVSPGYRVAALAFEPGPVEPPHAVPEPAMGWLAVAGLGALCAVRRRSPPRA